MTYAEKKPFAQRTFTIDGDSMRMTGRKSLGGTSFKMEISLSKLKPDPDEVTLKDENRAALVGAPGFLLFLYGVAFTVKLYAISPTLYYSIIATGILAMTFGFFVGGRIRAYVFRNRDEAVIFDVAEYGNPRMQFEAFVAAIRERIRTSQRQP